MVRRRIAAGISIWASIVLILFSGCNDLDIRGRIVDIVDATEHFPTVDQMSPGIDAEGVPVDGVITIDFSESLLWSTITTTSINITDADGSIIDYAITQGSDASIVVCTPNQSLDYDTAYTVDIGTTVANIAGNALQAGYSWSFTTESAPVTTGPSVALFSSVVQPSTNLDSFDVTVQFSEAVTGFISSDCEITNASITGFVASENPDFVVTLAPIDDGDVTVDIPQGVAQSTATGLTNLAATQFVRFSDRTLPAGSISIESGAAYTTSRDVVLNLTADDGSGSGVAHVLLANDSGLTSAIQSVAATTMNWQLAAGDGDSFVYYRVVDRAGNESPILSDVILLDTTDPAEVDPFSAAAGQESATLTWTDPLDTDFDRTELWYGTGGTADTSYGEVTSPTTLTGLDYHETYTFLLRTFDIHGNASDGVTRTATPWAYPAQPTTLTAATVTDTSISLSWTDAADNETGYLVRRGTTSGSYDYESADLGLNAGSFSDDTILEGTTYYYVVVATNDHGETVSQELVVSTVAHLSVSINPVTPDNPTIDFGVWDGILNRLTSESITITAAIEGGADAGADLLWYLNGELQSETGQSITLNSVDLEYGGYTLTVILTQSGVPYSAELRFDVQE